MAGGKKLSDAYVELRADDSKLSPDVKVKAKRIGKEFGSQLNNQLRALDLDPIDVKADPKSALASIETARGRLQDMSRDASSVEMRIRTERALAQVERFRRQLGAVDDKPVEPKVETTPAQRDIEQLQRRLSALGIDPPVAIDADPRAALAAVKRIDGELSKMAKDAKTVQVRLDAESARGDLARLRKAIGDVGEDSATGFVARFGARLGPLMGSLPVSAPLVGAVTAAGLLAAPTLAAIISGAVVGGVGVGGVVGGAILAARDPRVKTAGQELGGFILGDLERRAVGFVDPTLGGIARIRAAWMQLGPDIDRIFASSRFVDPLVDGAVSGARKLIGGIADVIDKADPAVDAFARSFDAIGDATGDALTTLADDADEGAAAIDDLTVALTRLIETGAGMVHHAATIKGWSEELDVAIDRGRYWLEDMKHYRGWLDLTADGFKVGSKEALAWREATLGTATAADFAALKSAGLTDAQIAAADASGTYRQKIHEVNAELLGTGNSAVATKEDVEQLKGQLDETATKFALFGEIGSGAMRGLLLSSGALTGAMIEQKSKADLLRQAHEALYGAAIKQTEANESYEASWDQLSETVKGNSDQIGRNKNNLDLHTKAGRSNRDALQELLTKSGEMYYADIEAGVAIDEARKKHEKRTSAVRTEAGQLKLNKTETDKLIETYGRIPPKKITNILIDGFKDVVLALTDLYAYQRSLATGKTINAARAEVNAALRGGYAGDPRRFKKDGGHIDGPPFVGTGTSDSNMIWASKGEFMQPTSSVDYYGVAAMQAIRHKQIPREVLQGYATGGLIDALKGRNWGSTMRYEVDVHGARIPSRAEVASKVVPEFGAWPSSPGAQRGDSGVWRRIMALVQNSGIPYTFGNAYRPGDPLWHGSGRAVDFMGYNQDRLARLFMGMQSRVLELIHRTNTGDYAISRGRRTSMPTQLPLHRNHLHVAMDSGGALKPGWNPPIYNGTGRWEPVTPAPVMDQMVARLDRLIEAVERRLIDAVERIGPAVAGELTGGVAASRQIGRVEGWRR
ncbi:hypothetical protein [Micromonospora sp. 4G55]|uniref:hypothetical protein n=1 Tax=Micromonospora sp. 4G55 TaxID=2806102 RepID=UPI001A5851BE|nr:hypothetical protein [Micromonospora sp. 4G55]MBM0257047.1 hypothetical protein [Micromonospora sp. 4G55]